MSGTKKRMPRCARCGERHGDHSTRWIRSDTFVNLCADGRTYEASYPKNTHPHKNPANHETV